MKQPEDAFATWSDGDDGDNARACNLIVSARNGNVSARDGKRFIVRNL